MITPNITSTRRISEASLVTSARRHNIEARAFHLNFALLRNLETNPISAAAAAFAHYNPGSSMSAFNANFLLNRQSRQSRKDEERESSSSWIREMTTDTLRYSGLYSTTLDASPNGSGVQIDIEENYDTIGTRVWDCSVLMSHQFLHHHRRLERQSSPNPNLLSFSSRTILEIGSGCGLLPIAMSKALPTGGITATEYLPGIIEHLQNQVSKNGCESDVKVAKLDWFCPEDINLVSRACDTLIMSDCTLNSRESPQILSTFEDILVTSYRHKFKEGGRVKHTDAIVGLCYQREVRNH